MAQQRAFSREDRSSFIEKKRLKMQIFFKVILEENARLVPVQHVPTALEYPTDSLLIRVMGRGFSPLLLSDGTTTRGAQQGTR